MIAINVVTLFPEVITPYLGASIPARAVQRGLATYRVVQLRDFATDRHRTVDDAPYGGGAGMVLKPEPVVAAVESLPSRGRTVVLSARGVPFDHDRAVRYSLEPALTLIAGHYKDVDQRVVEVLGADEVSIGDFILSGGELAALCVVDAVVRLLPGALGDHESASSDSYYEGLLSPPSYTRPPAFRGRKVPDVLLSGNHAEIEAWRRRQAEQVTTERRPDLWARHVAEQREE